MAKKEPDYETISKYVSTYGLKSYEKRVVKLPDDQYLVVWPDFTPCNEQLVDRVVDSCVVYGMFDNLYVATLIVVLSGDQFELVQEIVNRFRPFFVSPDEFFANLTDGCCG